MVARLMPILGRTLLKLALEIGETSRDSTWVRGLYSLGRSLQGFGTPICLCMFDRGLLLVRMECPA